MEGYKEERMGLYKKASENTSKLIVMMERISDLTLEKETAQETANVLVQQVSSLKIATNDLKDNLREKVHFMYYMDRIM